MNRNGRSNVAAAYSSNDHGAVERTLTLIGGELAVVRNAGRVIEQLVDANAIRMLNARKPCVEGVIETKQIRFARDHHECGRERLRDAIGQKRGFSGAGWSPRGQWLATRIQQDTRARGTSFAGVGREQLVELGTVHDLLYDPAPQRPTSSFPP
jgi:hypothetical protein